MGLGCLVQAVSGGETARSLSPLLSVMVGERFDSNVMLQNEGAQAGQESFVTSVLPVVGARLTDTGAAPYSVTLKYAPDFTFFHGLSRESYLRQIGLLDLDFATGEFSLRAGASVNYTDGTTEPPNWGTTNNHDQVPALGVTEVRSRRRNMYFSSGVVGRQDLGTFFVRGVFEARIWDFMTEDLFTPPNAVIQNYYDRSDINGGADIGLEAARGLEPYLGFRIGHQNQEFRANSPSYSYANNYDRLLVGLTAKPAGWVSFNGEIGPSLHFFDGSTLPPGANTRADYLYFQARAVFQISSNTTFTVRGGDHLLPASAGNAVFQNLTASGTLAHRFACRWTGSLSMGYTEYDFDGITRRDQRFVPEGSLEYRLGSHLSVRGSLAFEWGENELDIPYGSRRNYDRFIAGLWVLATY